MLSGLTGNSRTDVPRSPLLLEHEELVARHEELKRAHHELFFATDAFDLHRIRTWPPGHFYSPYPNLAELEADRDRIFEHEREILDVDLRENEQLELLRAIADLYESIPFTAESKRGFRYRYENHSYSYSDAIVLHSMIRLLEPKRLIEVGSGFSSAVTLDTNEHFFDGAIDLTFIEPYPDLLHSLLQRGDRKRVRMIDRRLQDVDLELFRELRAKDVLFIDSTHVSKAGSDVNWILFEILPRLETGVWVHFHDIFYPFEYPREWVEEGRAWSEIYMLRSFLTGNSAYRLRYFQDFLAAKHRKFFAERMPLCLKNTGGNFWIEKVG